MLKPKKKIISVLWTSEMKTCYKRRKHGLLKFGALGFRADEDKASKEGKRASRGNLSSRRKKE